DLVAGEFEHVGLRADEGDSRFGARPSQVRVLRQEAVTGVDGVCAALLRDAQHLLDAEVRADGVAFLADHIGFIGLHPVLGVAVFVGEDRDGGGSEFVGGTESTNSDLSAVGHENFREHRCLSLLYRPHWATGRQAVGNILYSVTCTTSAAGGPLPIEAGVSAWSPRSVRDRYINVGGCLS